MQRCLLLALTLVALAGLGGRAATRPIQARVAGSTQTVPAGQFTPTATATALPCPDGYALSFAPAVPYATGAVPYAVAAADFNSDGRPDLAVANGNSANVSILLGSGDGTFAPAVNYAVGTTPFAVVAADFNGDGRLDLVTANGNSANVSILLGTGDGTFAPAVNYAAGPGPVAVAAADFNGDGRLDLATANFGSNTVSILRGSGDGTFAPAVPVATGSNPRSVAAADVNGDGRLDLATANNTSSTVSILLNTGACAATPTVTATSIATAPPTGTPTRTNTATAPPTGTLTVLNTPTPPAPGTNTVTVISTSSANPLPSATAPAGPIHFSDVTDPAAYYYPGVYYLAGHGVISGYSDGTFRPFNLTTRGQMTKIVTLAFTLPLLPPPANGSRTFTDVTAADVFYQLIETAAAQHLVSGYTCGGSNPQTGTPEPCDSAGRAYFRPSNAVTRGQLTKIVVLGVGFALRTPPTPTFSDVAPGNVFYQFIETAVCHAVLSGYDDGTFRPTHSAFRGQIAKIVTLAATLPPGTCPARAARR